MPSEGREGSRTVGLQGRFREEARKREEGSPQREAAFKEGEGLAGKPRSLCPDPCSQVSTEHVMGR